MSIALKPTKQTTVSEEGESLMKRKVLLLVALLSAAPAMAGSATAQSNWNMGHALGEAKRSVPKGATITGTNCNEFQVRNDDRWSCTVTWD